MGSTQMLFSSFNGVCTGVNTVDFNICFSYLISTKEGREQNTDLL